ncbi:DUF4397 domain-containing protein [Mucilaginibacter ginkgonis]|uniref:DUF4397 domain-containing protein n=1 Tax=Mucilaginibacter ginkgonis TaxID=2682091 RepID=A0A6I4HV16_9SPHI|nr:DUF4397 domain-containing protein [Mucilaginibacter ginkgonis]QQL50021.1 DUF4397 domain-containing protein [Mucilaginibacter ginkgonis]
MKVRHLFFLIAIIAGFSSCKPSYDVVPATGLPSYLNVINSTQDTINIFLNGTRQNNTTTIFPLGNTNYLNVASGTNNFDFRRNGSPVMLFSKTLALKDTTYQTVFVCGESADKAFITRDTLKSSTIGARVRFVNTADGAGSLDLSINDVFTARGFAFQKLGGYADVAAGTTSLKVYYTGTTIPAATKTVALTTGSLYTVYVKATSVATGKPIITIGLFGK